MARLRLERRSRDNPIGRGEMDVVVITNSADEFKRALSSLVVDARSLVFDSGGKGLEYWRAEKPRFVFCDTALPDISGFRVAKTIANEKGRTATDVYLMSRNVTESDALWAKKQGATGVIECSPAAVYAIVSGYHESQPSNAPQATAGSVDIARLNEIDEAVRKILGPVAFVLAEEARTMLIRKNALTADAYAAQLARHIQDAAGRQRFLDQFVGG